MDKFESLAPNRLLFDLAARLGSLEGYLYAEEKVDTSYLPNWLENVEREFAHLAPQVKREIQPNYLELLKKVQALLQRLFSEQNPNLVKIKMMVADLAQNEEKSQ